MKIVIDNLVVNYNLVKSSKMVLLLHGWGDQASGLNNLYQYFIKNGYGVASLDLPGFGQSDNPPIDWDLKKYARFVSKFVSKLGLKVNILIGHSNGGAIAIKIVSLGLIQPQKLILISSAGIRSQYKLRNKSLRIVAKTAKVATFVLPSNYKKKAKEVFYRVIGSDMLIKEDLIETFKNVVSEDLTLEAEKITIPTLLIYGQNDKATPVLYGQIFHQKIKNSRLEIFDNVGHFIYLEEPGRLNMMIGDFIR